MYTFYERFCWLNQTAITRTLTQITNRVDVHTPRGKPKIYKRIRIRTAVVKYFRLKDGGLEHVGSKVDNLAVNIHFNLGTYWPNNDEDMANGNLS